MTVIVGLRCTDGVIVGADGACTFTAGIGQIPTIEQQTKKIDIIENSIILAGTGDVGLGQRFARIIQTNYKELLNIGNNIDLGVALSQMAIQNFLKTRVNPPDPRYRGAYDYGALVAFSLNKVPYLCEFDTLTFQPEFKEDRIWYVSMGSGQSIADPFLGFIRKVLWRDNIPNCREGIFAVIWTLLHAIDVNTGGINEPIQVAELYIGNNQSIAQARLLTEDEMAEHRERASELNSNIYKFYSDVFNN